MKTITIKQPWASLIIDGIKDIENRTWPTKFRGRVLVHSAESPAKGLPSEFLNGIQYAQVFTKNKLDSLNGLNGYILGSVDIVDCVINHPSIWAEKTKEIKDVDGNVVHEFKIYNWVLANPIKFLEPIPAKGKLSFWDFDLPEECLEECTSCGEKFHVDEMTEDSDNNLFCPECWKELSPVMRAECEETKKI